MITGERQSLAWAEVFEERFSLLLDNGSHESNYMSAKTADYLDKRRYKEELRVRVGDGSTSNVFEFCCIPIKIKLKDEVLFENYLKFYIFPELPFQFIIGRGDLVRYSMYGIMERIDRFELEVKRGAGGSIQSTEMVEEDDIDEMIATMVELDGDPPKITDWGTDLNPALNHNPDGRSNRREESEEEFQKYVELLREELQELIDRDYADVFASRPPKEPARVWPQVLKVIGEPIDTPEGLKKVPFELRGMGRRLPLKYVEAARTQIQELLEQGVIERSTSPISNPIQLTPKPGTNPPEMRFCLDCRKVNSLMKRENFPMGGMNEFFSWMEEVQPEFFIKLDLKAMYFQLPLDERSRMLTAFNFAHEKFQFTRVVMGVANSVGHAQNVMVNLVLAGLVMTKLFAYLDDLMLPGNRSNPLFNIKKNLIEVLDRFRKYRCYLNKAKCEIVVTETIFLGHKISRRGVEVSPKKKVDFAAIPRPVTVTTLRSFLALGSYFRRFLPNFAERARNLYKLTSGPKQKRIEWTEETTKLFVDIKTMVQQSVILRWMTKEGEVFLFCDASKYGFGGGILQDQGELDDDGKKALTPISFYGRAFADYQVKWHTSDREMFAICFGVTTHHYLLAGRSFKVFTDHAALLSIRESASERVNRMKEKLTSYNMTLHGIAGKDQVVGDGLSRIFVNEEVHIPPKEDEDIEGVIEAYSNQSLMTMETEDLEYLHLLRHYHGERGHWALDRTMTMIKDDNNMWPKCEETMKAFIDSCEVCKENEPRRQRFHGRQFSISSDGPGKDWSIDLKEVGEGYAGHKYVLCIIDNFSRRATMYPLKGKTAEEATYFIWHHLMENGRPERVRYDPGREFNNEIMKEITRFLRMNEVQVAAGDHASNGIVEKFIGELDGQLRKYFQERPRGIATDWIWFLPVIAKNHNEIRHSTTGLAPNTFYGERYWSLPESEREKLVEFVKGNICKNKGTKPNRANGEEVIVGVQIYIMVESKEKRNLEAVNWQGPFTVIARVGDYVEIEERRGYKYHISRLKLA